jgi:hypothetical protein
MRIQGLVTDPLTPPAVALFVALRSYIVYRQGPLGPVDPSFQALSGRIQFTFRRHEFKKDSLSSHDAG